MSGFSRTILFGLLAAVSLPASVVALSPVLGASDALAMHAIGAVSGYLAILVPGLRRRLCVLALAGAFGLLVWLFAGSLAELALGLSLEVAVVRSGLLYRLSYRLSYGPRAQHARGGTEPSGQGRLRAVAIEAIVLLVALLTARFLAVPGLVGGMLALWGWFVAQSFYFLFDGLAPRRRQPQGDPFEAARRGLEELLLPRS
jgi:hypothetical protein